MKVKTPVGEGVVQGYTAVHHVIVAIVLIDNKLHPVDITKITVEREPINAGPNGIGEPGSIIPVGSSGPTRSANDTGTSGRTNARAAGSKG